MSNPPAMGRRVCRSRGEPHRFELALDRDAQDLSETQQHRRHRAHRHACARPPYPRQRCDACRHLDRRYWIREPFGKSAGVARDGESRAGERRSRSTKNSITRPTATNKYHIVAYDFGVKTNSLREFSQIRLPRDGRSGGHFRGRSYGSETRRHFSLERPRRPGVDDNGRRRDQKARLKARRRCSASASAIN